jgi:Transposase IS116/IS110/IS902 family
MSAEAWEPDPDVGGEMHVLRGGHGAQSGLSRFTAAPQPITWTLPGRETVLVLEGAARIESGHALELAAGDTADGLAEAVAAVFAELPDSEILTSFPGIGPVTGAWVLGEIGDDRARLRDARRLKAYAGSAPIAVASGKSLMAARTLTRLTARQPEVHWRRAGRRSVLPGTRSRREWRRRPGHRR